MALNIPTGVTSNGTVQVHWVPTLTDPNALYTMSYDLGAAGVLSVEEMDAAVDGIAEVLLVG